MEEKIKQIFENIKNDFFTILKENQNKPSLEVEVHFGFKKKHISGATSFQSEIPSEWFHSQYNKFMQSNTWKEKPTKKLIEECIFPYEKSLKTLKSSSHFNNEDVPIRLRREHNQISQFIKKKNIKYYDFDISSVSILQFRIAIKEEIPIENCKDNIPNWIRLKERTSFNYDDRFSYDFTKVWSGTSMNEILNYENKINPTYELEIECLKIYQYKTEKDWNAFFESFQSKIIQLLLLFPKKI